MGSVTVIFDLDGTLVDTAPDLCHALNHVLEQEGYPPLALEKMRPHVALGAAQIMAAGLYEAGAKVPENVFHDMVARMVAHYEAHIAVDSRIYPGIEAVLTGMQRQNMTLAVCTNKYEHLAEKLLQEIGLRDYFRAVAGGDSYPVKKPDPGHLTSLLEQVNGRPERAVMVGDSDTDIAAARGAGIPVVAVTYGYSHEPIEMFAPDIVLHDAGAVGDAVCALVDCGEPAKLH